jgi:hypothetical protein
LVANKATGPCPEPKSSKKVPGCPLPFEKPTRGRAAAEAIGPARIPGLPRDPVVLKMMRKSPATKSGIPHLCYNATVWVTLWSR